MDNSKNRRSQSEKQSKSRSREDFHKHDRKIKHDKNSSVEKNSKILINERKGDAFHPVEKSKILVIERKGGVFPDFQKPTIRGQFSVNEHREFEPNCNQLKYLQFNYNMKVSFDLNDGMKYCIRKNHPPEYLNHIFLWFKKHNYIVNGRICSQLQDVFVCFRGLLTQIMCTPFEESEGWIICAKQYDGTIFLCAFDTEEKIRRQQNETERQKQMCSWGYKFEQYMLSENPKTKPNTNHPVNENEEWCCLFSSKLSGHKLFYGAEMDGVISDDIIDVDKDPRCLQKVTFVELKTNRHIETRRHDRSFLRYKLLKWWCQSFLVGIEMIICGFRDDAGMVGRIEKYSVKDLPKMAKGHWEPSVCMNFCAQFLDFVKTCLNGAKNSVWIFNFNPGEPISARDLGSDQSYDFFPEWLKKV